MNTLCLFFLVYLAHSSVIQALKCYNGSSIIGTPWDIPTEKERQEFEARERTRMETKFPLIECDSEFTQCFKIVPDCGIQDAYGLVKGCAMPEGNSSCVQVMRHFSNASRRTEYEWNREMWCWHWNMENSKCKMCSNGNGCNKEEWQIVDDKMESSTLPTSTTTDIIGISISTTDENDIVAVTTNGNMADVVNLRAICITAFLIILSHGMSLCRGMWTLLF